MRARGKLSRERCLWSGPWWSGLGLALLGVYCLNLSGLLFLCVQSGSEKPPRLPDGTVVADRNRAVGDSEYVNRFEP